MFSKFIFAYKHYNFNFRGIVISKLTFSGEWHLLFTWSKNSTIVPCRLDTNGVIARSHVSDSTMLKKKVTTYDDIHYMSK